MAVPKSPQPGEGKPTRSGMSAAAATGPPNRGPAGGVSNRPIPLTPTDDNPLPDALYDEEDEVDDLSEILRNAPAWLVSTGFHTLLLIVLALLATVTITTETPQVDVEVSNVAEQIGTQLEDPSVLVGESSHVENPHEKEQMITQRDLPPVDDPLAAPPALGDIKLDVGGISGIGSNLLTGPQTIEGAPIGLALSGRRPGSKNVLLGRYGGNATTEAAVERGLRWLVKQQKSDGSWSLAGPYTQGALGENSAAATAMALLAFQGHGDTTREGPHSRSVVKGWNWLLRAQQKDGLFASATSGEQNQKLYTHAQCTIALCELYGMTKESAYRGPAERAIAYALAAQDKQGGGWRYQPGMDSDTSVTGWFVMALQSARMAGMSVPDEALADVNRYLDSAAIDDGRRYGYWTTANPSMAMAAEGLLCRQYLGWKRNDPRLVEGVEALNRTPVSYNSGPNQDVYYWYYATQATHHMGGKIWDDWNQAMRQAIPEAQVKEGAEAGSWSPTGDKWGSFGGRLYVTCLSIYNLEVYYRHLPLYSSRSLEVPPPAADVADKERPEPETRKQDAEPEGNARVERSTAGGIAEPETE